MNPWGQLQYDRNPLAWSGWISLPAFVPYTAAARQEADRAALRRLGGDPEKYMQLAAPRDEADERAARGEYPLLIEPPRPQVAGWSLLRHWWNTRGQGPPPPNAAQEQAYEYLVEHEAAVAAALMEATFSLYQAEWPSWRLDLESLLGEETALLLPELKAPSDLQRLLRLTSVTILGLEVDGIAPVQFRFLCTWDDEHGYEIYSVGERVSLEEPGW
jgi:hypothetical protein